MAEPSGPGPGASAAAAAAATVLRIQVCLALPDRAVDVALRLPAGATVADAVDAALAGAAGAAFTEALGGAEPAAVGVFGHVVPMSRPLIQGDRVELYRPLVADPKLARRQRVERQRATAGRSRWRPDA